MCFTIVSVITLADSGDIDPPTTYPELSPYLFAVIMEVLYLKIKYLACYLVILCRTRTEEVKKKLEEWRTLKEDRGGQKICRQKTVCT